MKVRLFFVWPYPVATATCPEKEELSHGGKKLPIPRPNAT